MRRLLSKSWRHILACAIIALLLVFIFYKEWMFVGRLCISGQSFFQKLKSYFLYFTGSDCKADYLLPKVTTLGNVSTTISKVDIQSFWLDCKVYFKILANLTGFLSWILKISENATSLSRTLMLIGIAAIILILLINNYFTENNKSWRDKSKPLTIWEDFRDGPLRTSKIAICDYAIWFFHTPYFITMVTIIIVSFGAPSIVMDIIGEYFYFFARFDFISLIDAFITTVVTICNSFGWLPPFVWVLIAFIIWRFITLINGRKLIEGKLVPQDEKMANSDTGVFTLILGKMRGGKTTLATALARICDVIYHKNAYDNMSRVSLMFPEFPFQAFEKDIVRLAAKRRIINMNQAAAFAYRLYEKGCKTPLILYGYSIERRRTRFYDGACDVELDDALAIYAESYWIYFHGDNLIASNYPIRTDDLKLDKGHLVIWDFKTFRRRNRKGLWGWSKLSHILVFDMLRFGKKVDENNIFKDCGGPMIAVATEFGKEYGNMVTNQSYSAVGEEANPKNDLLDYSLKLGGHLANIWHTNFFKFIADEQRSGSLSSNLVDVAQTIFTADPKNQEEKCAVHLFWLEPAILDFILKIREKFYKKYRYLREDQTLMFHIINSLGSMAYAIESLVYNRYGYKKVRLPSCTADSSGNLQEGEIETFYIINYIDYALRFESACMKDFLNAKKQDASKGFFDLPTYKGLMPTKREWDLQGSYVVSDLEEPTRRFGNLKAARTRNGSRRQVGADRFAARRKGDEL